MTTDLGNLIRSGLAGKEWHHGDVQEALEAFLGSGTWIDWERGDEEWGRVLDVNGDVLVLVCARIPIGFLLERVDTDPLPDRVSWYRVNSMSDKAFSVEQRLLEEVFGRKLSDAVDYARLSVNDLWWTTV